MDAGDPARAAELLDDGLGLWRGSALVDVAFEDFAQPEIGRLEELRLIGLEARADAALECGRHPQVVAELEGLLAQHPTRERLACQLMLALYRSQRQAAALEVYQRTRMRLAEELRLEPGPELKAIQAQILDHAPSLQAGSRSAHPVISPPAVEDHAGTGVRDAMALPRTASAPLAPTPTIGRQGEVQDVSRLLGDPDVRLVTLTGPGGVGKTRLALAVAHAIRSAFPDGVCWVELAGVARPEDVASAMARALAVSPLPGESTEDALGRYLAGKQVLLVADNFEHVLDAAVLIADLLAASRGLIVLATSREALNLTAEHRVRVAPLSLPALPGRATVAEVEAADTTALFLTAVRRRDARFAISPTTALAVAGVCARLDGLPLALELAAARTGLLGIQELAAELDQALSGLGVGSRDTPARHHTLHATLTWSYRLLDEPQRTAFARLAVFAGGATINAAQVVTGATLDTLEALIAKSLLDRRQSPDGSTRLAMLETVRHYAQQQLAHDPEQHTIRRRHLEHYLHLVIDTAGRLSTRDEPDAMRVLDREIDNITAALHCALEHSPPCALRLAGELGEYWRTNGSPDALLWLDAALDAAGEQASPRDRAHAQLRRAQALHRGNRHSAALSAAEQALELYHHAGDHAGLSRTHRELASSGYSATSNAPARPRTPPAGTRGWPMTTGCWASRWPGWPCGCRPRSGSRSSTTPHSCSRRSATIENWRTLTTTPGTSPWSRIASRKR